MTTYAYNDVIFTRTNIAIPDYSGGLYPETTDVYNNGAGPFITFDITGPVTVTSRSYGGFAGWWMDGVDQLVPIGPSSPTYDTLNLQPFDVPAGLHNMGIFNMGAGIGSSNFAFAGMIADFGATTVPTTQSFQASGSINIPPTLNDWYAAVANRHSSSLLWAALGDSVTEGQGASDGAHAWVSLLNAGLVAYDGSYFTATNDGVSGAKVSDIISGGYVAALNTGTDLVTIELGINDAYNSVGVPTFTTNLNTLVDSVIARCADASIIIIGAHLIDTIVEATWDTYLAAMSSVASTKGAYYLDMDAIFGDPDTNGLLADGVHPNDTGHKIYADTLFRLLV